MAKLNKENAEQGSSHDEVPAPDTWYGTRHTQAILMFLLLTLGYGMRVNLSVGIVAMTDPDVNPNKDIPTYNWDDKSIILSSFFWGYVIPQIGAGQLAKKYGPKWFLVGTMFINSFFGCLIPVMADLGSWGVIICRVMQGLAQGFIFPSCHSLLAKWAPPSERSRLGTFVYAGGPFGTVLSLPITGWISDSSIGWPWSFYLYGVFGMIWIAAWTFLGYNSPAEHPRIDPIEKKYIEASLGQSENREPPPTPWKAIATSLPVWAILVAHSGQNWGFSTLLTNIPTYMGSVLDFDIKSNGLLSAAPYFGFWVMSFVFSAMTDYIITRKIVSIAVARKITNSIGLYVPAVALLVLGLISGSESDITITLTLLFIAVGINSCCFCGYNVNHIDLSPIHAGTLMGITNGFSNIFSIIAPLVLQWIVTDETNPLQWATVFYISSGIYILGNTFFVLFGSGDVQPWNSVDYCDSGVVRNNGATKEGNETKETSGTQF